MRQKNKYLVEIWYYNTWHEHTYYKRNIEGKAEEIWWKRKLKTEENKGTITLYKITKIE